MRRHSLLVLLAAVPLVATGCASGGSDSGHDGKVTVTGQFKYVGFTEGSDYFDQDLRLTGGDGCEGVGKYAQVRAGMWIAVDDIQGNEIGQATIGAGEVTNVTPFTDDDGSDMDDVPPMTTCSFPYSVSVPAMKNYTVHAPGFTKTANANGVAEGTSTVTIDLVVDSTSGSPS